MKWRVGSCVIAATVLSLLSACTHQAVSAHAASPSPAAVQTEPGLVFSPNTAPITIPRFMRAAGATPTALPTWHAEQPVNYVNGLFLVLQSMGQKVNLPVQPVDYAFVGPNERIECGAFTALGANDDFTMRWCPHFHGVLVWPTVIEHWSQKGVADLPVASALRLYALLPSEGQPNAYLACIAGVIAFKLETASYIPPSAGRTLVQRAFASPDMLQAAAAGYTLGGCRSFSVQAPPQLNVAPGQ